MTHEPKPESAEFRTREAQRDILAYDYMKAGMGRNMAFAVAERHILEAEARGAAEERRKDAEGEEPFAWGVTLDIEMGYPFLAHETPISPIPDRNVPLYTCPANVAALEARVKELEGVKGRKQEEARRYRNALSNIVAKTGSHAVSHRIALEALAAIREGGEHGELA